jgi:GNAT superfamily N-acetyltransferase
MEKGDGTHRIAAAIDGATVALADFTHDPSSDLIRLKSIVVDAARRGRGIGQSLLERVEAEARALGARKIEAAFDARTEFGPRMRAIFAKKQWREPHPSLVMCRADDRVLEADWMNLRLPDACEIFRWTEISASDLGEIEARRAEFAWPEDLAPLRPDAVETINSVGLRKAGRVVGWMLTKRASADTICYERLFVHPRHRARATGIALIAAAIRRSSEAGIRLGSLNVRGDNAPMLAIVERRLAPYLASLSELVWVEKRL